MKPPMTHIYRVRHETGSADVIRLAKEDRDLVGTTGVRREADGRWTIWTVVAAERKEAATLAAWKAWMEQGLDHIARQIDTRDRRKR